MINSQRFVPTNDPAKHAEKIDENTYYWYIEDTKIIKPIVKDIRNLQMNLNRLESEVYLHRVSFGNSFRMWRESQGMSLRSLAKRLDISPAFLSDMELAKRNFSKQVIKKIEALIKQPNLTKPVRSNNQ